jgi:hypothetical protein
VLVFLQVRSIGIEKIFGALPKYDVPQKRKAGPPPAAKDDNIFGV